MSQRTEADGHEVIKGRLTEMLEKARVYVNQTQAELAEVEEALVIARGTQDAAQGQYNALKAALQAVDRLGQTDDHSTGGRR